MPSGDIDNAKIMIANEAANRVSRDFDVSYCAGEVYDLVTELLEGCDLSEYNDANSTDEYTIALVMNWICFMLDEGGSHSDYCASATIPAFNGYVLSDADENSILIPLVNAIRSKAIYPERELGDLWYENVIPNSITGIDNGNRITRKDHDLIMSSFADMLEKDSNITNSIENQALDAMKELLDCSDVRIGDTDEYTSTIAWYWIKFNIDEGGSRSDLCGDYANDAINGYTIFETDTVMLVALVQEKASFPQREFDNMRDAGII